MTNINVFENQRSEQAIMDETSSFNYGIFLMCFITPFVKVELPLLKLENKKALFGASSKENPKLLFLDIDNAKTIVDRLSVSDLDFVTDLLTSGMVISSSAPVKFEILKCYSSITIVVEQPEILNIKKFVK